MSLKGKSLIVLTPMYGGVNTSNYFMSWTNTIHACMRAGVTLAYNLVWNESLIPRARNRLVDFFLKRTEMTHCVFIDADIGWDPIELLSMLEQDEDIMGVPASKKSIRFDRIQTAIREHPEYVFSADELKKLGGDFVLNFEPFVGNGSMDLREMQDMRNLGTGLLMIKRSAFETIRDTVIQDEWYESRTDPAAIPGPIYDFFPSVVNKESREYESEDYGFCMLAKRAGLKITLCPWVRTTHMGTWVFEGDMVALAKFGANLHG